MFKKIDVFYNGHYLHSTNSYKTCREAKQAVINYMNNTDERCFSLIKSFITKMKLKGAEEFESKKLQALFDHNAKN